MIPQPSEAAAGATSWTIYGPALRGRTCGSCKACCTIVPVALPDGDKPGHTRCKHLRGTGCGIYRDRPLPCRAWSCRWLFGDEQGLLRRPDQGGYVIDAALDTILRDDEPMECVQVWLDPARPDAHRDPGLRAYLAGIGEVHGLVAIVRRSSSDGFVLVPPALSGSRDWLELESGMHTHEEMDDKMAALGRRRFDQGGVIP